MEDQDGKATLIVPEQGRGGKGKVPDYGQETKGAP